MDLTEDMLDAVLIKVDANAYNDRGDFSSDLDSDDDMYHIRIGESNDLSDKSSESSSDTSVSSPGEEAESFVSFNHDEIKLMKSEVRLTPIDASLLQSNKIICTSINNVECTGKNVDTLSKIDETTNIAPKVKENPSLEEPKLGEKVESVENLPSVTSKLVKIVPKPNLEEKVQNVVKFSGVAPKLVRIAPKVIGNQVLANCNPEARTESGAKLQTAPKLIKIYSKVKENPFLLKFNSVAVSEGGKLQSFAPKLVTIPVRSKENNASSDSSLNKEAESNGTSQVTAPTPIQIAPKVNKSPILENSGLVVEGDIGEKIQTISEVKINDIPTSKGLELDLHKPSNGTEKVIATDEKLKSSSDTNVSKNIPVPETCKNSTVIFNGTNDSGWEVDNFTEVGKNGEELDNKSLQVAAVEVTIKEEHEPISPGRSSQVQEIMGKLEELKGTISTFSKSTDQSKFIQPPIKNTSNINGEEDNSSNEILPPQNDRSPSGDGLKPTEIKSFARTTEDSAIHTESSGVTENKTERVEKQSEEAKKIFDESEDESDHDGLCIDLKGDEVKTPPKPGTSPVSVALSLNDGELPKLTVRNFLLDTDKELETTTDIKIEHEDTENKLTLYGETDVPSIMTVHLLCMNCIEYSKKKWPNIPLMKHILVKKKDCEVCKTKGDSSEKTPAPEEKTKESTATNMSNVDKVIENVARNFSKNAPSSPPSGSLLEEVLRNAVPKTKGGTPQEVILVKSSKTTTNFTTKGSNIVIKDIAMKNAIKNASRNVKPAGMTTLDGKLYKVIFLPKTSSTKTIIASSGMKIAEDSKVVTKVVMSDKSGKLTSPNHSSLHTLSPAEDTIIVSNSNFKKPIENQHKSTADMPTVPNRAVFTSPKSSSFTTSLICNSINSRNKFPSKLSIIKPDSNKLNIINKRVSLDSAGTENSKKRSLDSPHVPDNIKIKRLSADNPITLSPDSKFIPLNDYLTLNRNSNGSGPMPVRITYGSKLATSNKPLTSFGGKTNDSRLCEEGAITMSTNCVKRPRMSVIDDSSYLSNGLDEGAKISILNSVLLPPFCPTTPDSVYDASNPVVKYTCQQCPDTFSSESHLQSHLNRRSVLMKYACPACPNKVVAVYNRCQLKEHCKNHNMKVNLQCLTIEPLPLALFDLNLFNSTPTVSNSTSKINTMLQAKKRKRKSRAKKVPEIFPKPNPSPSQEMPDQTTSSVAAAASSTAAATSSAVASIPKTSAQKQTSNAESLTFCNECESLFPSLSAHLQDGGKPKDALVCEWCKKVCSSACSLKAHKRLHNKTPPHICPECGAKFLFASALEEHFKKSCYHPFKKNSYECLRCHQNFSVLQKVETHLLRKHTQQVNICGVCEKSDMSLSVISEHMKNDHGELVDHNSNRVLRFMKCDFCPDSRFPRHQVQQHIQMHMKQQNSFAPNYYYQCESCSTYKTITKVDFGQHLDYCLFSTSLRIMENNQDLSDSEESVMLSSKSLENLRPINSPPTQQSQISPSGSSDETTSHSKSSETTMSVSMDKMTPQSECPTTEIPVRVDKAISKPENLEKMSICSDGPSAQFRSEGTKSDYMPEAKSPETTFIKEKTPLNLDSDTTTIISEAKTQVVNCEGEPLEIDKSAESNVTSKETLKTNIESSAPEKKEPSKKPAHCSSKTNPKPTIMQCKYCPEKFRDPQKVFEHLISKHAKLFNKRPINKKTAPSQSTPKSTTSDDSPQSLECSKCNFVGSTYEDLFNHMETHKTVYKCSKCGEGFVARPSLEKHLIIIHQFDAAKAKEEVDSNNQSTEVVKEHGAYHAKQGFYQCATCYKNFTSEEVFKQHFRTHGLAFVTDSASPTSHVK